MGLGYHIFGGLLFDVLEYLQIDDFNRYDVAIPLIFGRRIQEWGRFWIGPKYDVAFVHIDANAVRIHGDHDPVDGKYPVRLWNEGDVIVDRQRLEVPPNYASGSYTIFVGFYSGEARMVVKSGPKDDANRVNAGVLRIR